MNALWALITIVAPTSTLEAPVYVQLSENVLRRSGTFVYKPGEDNYQVLFCIATPPKVVMKCLVRTPGDLLVMIEATASEQGT